MRCHAHALLTTGHDNVTVAVGDGLKAERYSAKARTAKLVDAPGGHFHRQTGIDRGLTRRILAFTGLQDLAHDDFRHLILVHARAIQRRVDRNRAQLMRGQR